MISGSGNDGLLASAIPIGQIEPHASLLSQPVSGQLLYKVMAVENLIKSIEGRYLHFNRVDHYKDFSTADADDGAELPQDKIGNHAAKFEKAPTFSLSNYYMRSRERTYASCFSLENSEYIWHHYGNDTKIGQVCLEIDFDKLRKNLNRRLAGNAALMYGEQRCHQVFSINYGKIIYVSRDTHRANTEYAPNPIEYAYLKDERFAAERELRITLSTVGMGRFSLADGQIIDFYPNLQFEFDFHDSIKDGTITQILAGRTTNMEHLEAEFSRLGIGIMF